MPNYDVIIDDVIHTQILEFIYIFLSFSKDFVKGSQKSKNCAISLAMFIVAKNGFQRSKPLASSIFFLALNPFS